MIRWPISQAMWHGKYPISIAGPRQRNVYNTIMNDFIHDLDGRLLVISQFL
jgi:hypothetical protein